MSYLPGAEYFWIAADDPSLALSGLFYWVHLFRMTMFFLFAFFWAECCWDALDWLVRPLKQRDGCTTNIFKSRLIYPWREIQQLQIPRLKLCSCSALFGFRFEGSAHRCLPTPLADYRLLCFTCQ